MHLSVRRLKEGHSPRPPSPAMSHASPVRRVSVEERLQQARAAGPYDPPSLGAGATAGPSDEEHTPDPNITGTPVERPIESSTPEIARHSFTEDKSGWLNLNSDNMGFGTPDSGFDSAMVAKAQVRLPGSAWYRVTDRLRGQVGALDRVYSALGERYAEAVSERDHLERKVAPRGPHPEQGCLGYPYAMSCQLCVAHFRLLS